MDIALYLSVRQLMKCEERIAEYIDLQDADLQDADLQDADLRGANLRGADLRYTYLQEATLQYADLRFADLRYANLKGADLRDTILDQQPIPITDLSAFDSWDNDPEWIVGWRTKNQPYMGGPEYEVGKEYEATYFMLDTSTSCAPGLYLWPELHMVEESPAIKVVAMKREVLKAGDKYRCKRFYVVDEIK